MRAHTIREDNSKSGGETPLCRRPRPDDEWQTGAAGDNGGVERFVYQTRAETEPREGGSAAQREELDIELERKKLNHRDSFVYLGGEVHVRRREDGERETSKSAGRSERMESS